MFKHFAGIIFVISVFFFGGNAFATMHCHNGWGGGDNGYSLFQEVVISDKPITRSRARSEVDLGYTLQKDAHSATLALTVGWYKLERYGSDVVLLYYPGRKTEKAFVNAHYQFARKCLEGKLSTEGKEQLKVAVLNPKAKTKKGK